MIARARSIHGYPASRWVPPNAIRLTVRLAIVVLVGAALLIPASPPVLATPSGAQADEAARGLLLSSLQAMRNLQSGRFRGDVINSRASARGVERYRTEIQVS